MQTIPAMLVLTVYELWKPLYQCLSNLSVFFCFAPRNVLFDNPICIYSALSGLGGWLGIVTVYLYIAQTNLLSLDGQAI